VETPRKFITAKRSAKLINLRGVSTNKKELISRLLRVSFQCIDIGQLRHAGEYLQPWQRGTQANHK
jgi:hypothetical protein